MNVFNPPFYSSTAHFYRQWTNGNVSDNFYYQFPPPVMPYRGLVPNYLDNYSRAMPNSFGYSPVMVSPPQPKRVPGFGGSKKTPVWNTDSPVSVCGTVQVVSPSQPKRVPGFGGSKNKPPVTVWNTDSPVSVCGTAQVPKGNPSLKVSPPQPNKVPGFGGSKSKPPATVWNTDSPVSVCGTVQVPKGNRKPKKKNWDDKSMDKAARDNPTQPSSDHQTISSPKKDQHNLQTNQQPIRRGCSLCRQNGDKYYDHPIKDSNGKVVCPVLFKYVCPYCNATGENAHTEFYCPLKPTKAHVPLAIRLKSTSRDSCGRLRNVKGKNDVKF